MAQPMPHGPVEVLPRDHPGQLAVVPVRDVTDAGDERRDVLDVPVGPGGWGDDAEPRYVSLPARAVQPLEQLALLRLKWAAKVPGEELLVRSRTHARGKDLRVAVVG